MRIGTSPHSLRTAAIVDSKPGETIVLVVYISQLDRLTRAITIKGQAAAGVHDLPLSFFIPPNMSPPFSLPSSL